MRKFPVIGIILMIGASACNDLNQDPVVLELGDEPSFKSDVQAYLGAGCASLACHGDLGRSFRTYAELGLRLTPDLRDQPISDEEVFLNLQSIAAQSPEVNTVENHLILKKGLAKAAGGFAHEGGEIWENTNDPGYQCLLAWLEGRTTETTTPCAAAYELVKPADP